MILVPATTLSLSYGPAPVVRLSMRLQRDGEFTAGYRKAVLYRGLNTLAYACAVFEDEGRGDGVCDMHYDISLAESLQQGEWLLIGTDNTAPRRIRAVYLQFAEDLQYTLDITGSTGAGAGDPAQVDARVRVARVPANREVVMLERPADGGWRLAGYGLTPGGAGEIDLRVVGGDVFAVAVDDYGVAFVADLAVQVGQRIRPTQYSGWVYEITDAGQLPSVEPEWWAAVGDNPSQPIGTARAVARRYFQPIAHGPVPVEVI